MPVQKLTKRDIDALPVPAKRTVYYDEDLKGFGLVVLPSGKRSWVVEYRPGGRGRTVHVKRYRLGSFSDLSPDQARKAAQTMLAKVRLGGDPARDQADKREMLTVKALAERFLDDGCATKKDSTVAIYRIHVNKHIIPAIGSIKADAITRADIKRLHRKIGSTARPTANRVVNLLSGVFRWAIEEGLLPEQHANPAKGVEKYREDGRERFLSSEELRRLGDAIAEAETIGVEWTPDPDKQTKHAPAPENRRTTISRESAAAIRLLIFTGARLREILHLRWEYVDEQRGLLLLPDSKTGKKAIPLNAPALAVLASLTRVGPYVIPGDDLQKHRADLHRPWRLVTKRAGLEGLRIHDLRHTFASVGAGAALGLQVIGKLLGHAQSSTTERYAHLADDPLRRASEAIAQTIAASLSPGTARKAVIEFKRQSH